MRLPRRLLGSLLAMTGEVDSRQEHYNTGVVEGQTKASTATIMPRKDLTYKNTIIYI